ncbi:12159_t:CDS:2 [Acaulospora colombiana]|uniref:12159_t:CDS:1 n=1 Tax=Acaulospora colombiana TaxID=27376 RepID=A0ACA9LDI1_9GLOM|nr:12159_t:CDS:2 [Acaulospora colombiana]
MRFPYWDWASPSTLTHGIPSVIFDEYVNIDNPVRKNVKIRNPLRAYTLPEDLGSLGLVGDESNPTQRPYVPDATSPYTPKGYATVRHPDTNYFTNADATNLDVITSCSSVFRPNIYQVFLVNNWREFSNHGDPADGKPDSNYGHYSSIEVAHDAVHGAACHPEAWIVGNEDTEGTFTQAVNKRIDENTPLTPFRKAENDYWTSKDVRYTKTLGYNYPELQHEKVDPRGLLLDMLDYYHPNLFLQYHWRLTLKVKKNKVGLPFQLRVFLDLPTASPSTPITSPNYAGYISIFARGRETQCANCANQKEAVVNGNVDLTMCMKRLFIDLNPGSRGDTVSQSLTPNQITILAVLNDGSGISLEEVGLISADYWVYDEGPKYDQEYENWSKKHVGQVYPQANN